MTCKIGRVMLKLAAGVMMLAPAAAGGQDYDIVIRGGRVLDGAGNPWIRADVAIRDGRIARIGDVGGRGAKEIDAGDRYVAPGFIDMMDQSGEVLLKNGAAENKLRMGVTTLIAGEGGTPVPAAEIPDYFAQLERGGISVNFGSYYAARQARVRVLGDRQGTATPEQLAAMKSEVAVAMSAGAFGIATALIYPPDAFLGTDELAALASEVARCDGLYATHLRDEGVGLIAAINEAIAIGERSGARVEIFHLKAAYAPAWGRLMREAVAAIDSARSRGADVAADLYPYRAGGTAVRTTIPNRLFERGAEDAWRQLRDPAVREALKAEVAAGSQPGWSNLVQASGGWENVVLANAYNPRYAHLHGRSFAAIGRELGMDPAEAAWTILLDALPNDALALFFMMDEGDIDLALRQPWTSIGSDAAAAEPGQVDALGLPHPRAYGTFPRVLARYARERNVLSLEEAIRKMTSLPAGRMGLRDRGLLSEGHRADVVVFDYARLDDRANWTNPTAAPVGIKQVIVNGVLTLDRGGHTGARAGMVLRHECRRR